MNIVFMKQDLSDLSYIQGIKNNCTIPQSETNIQSSALKLNIHFDTLIKYVS